MARKPAPAPRAPRAKSGPRPLYGETLGTFTFRLSSGQREKLETLGGAEWLRQKIDRAAG